MLAGEILVQNLETSQPRYDEKLKSVEGPLYVVLYQQ